MIRGLDFKNLVPMRKVCRNFAPFLHPRPAPPCQCAGCVVLLVQSTGGGVDGAWAGRSFACWTGSRVVILDAVDGKHLSPDQALGIAGHQNLAEQRFDLGAEVGYKLGDVGVAGLAVAAGVLDNWKTIMYSNAYIFGALTWTH